MKKILLTGGNGFLGKHVYNLLKTNYNTIRFSSKNLDLTETDKSIEYFNKVKPNIVVHMAARLGGIGDNVANPLAYYETNLNIGVNVLKASKACGVDHVINIGTVCSYPQKPSLPFTEDELWNGLPEPSNRYYGLAKRAVLDYAMILSESGKLNVTNLLMANLYGIGDDFRDKTSHVIPALIKKIQSLENSEQIDVWGDGTPSKDFLNVKDAAEVITKIIDIGYKETFPINVGTGKETTINQIVQLILELYQKNNIKINHILSKPNGQPRRVLNINRLSKLYNIKPSIKLNDGIQETIHWYESNKKSLNQLGNKYE